MKIPEKINIIDLIILFYANKFTIDENKNKVIFFEDIFAPEVRREPRRLFVQEREKLKDNNKNNILSFYCLTYSEIE